MKFRKTAAGLMAILMAASLAACGNDEVSESLADTSISAPEESTDAATSDEIDETEDKSESKDDSGKTTTVAADKSDKTTETTAVSTEKSSKTPTTTKAASGGNTSSGGKSTTASTTKAASGGNSATTTEPASSADPEEKEYTAEITLGSSPKITGSNAKAEGSVVKITAGGDYRFTGKVSEGQIFVSTATEEKVTIILDGVDITSSNGPAILIDEAKKCTIKLAAGSDNYITDGGKDKINDGAVFSNDTLRFKGSGTLNISANNEHGIASDDDIIIENGTFNITSKKSGIIANDDITINGGEIHIEAGTNGIKSKGTVNINGGASYISGGSKEEKSSIYASAAFYYTGGSVYAVGNTVTAPSSSYPFIVVDYVNGASAGSEASLELNGTRYANVVGRNPFRCVLMLNENITAGSTFVPYLDGSAGPEFMVESGKNVFRVE